MESYGVQGAFFDDKPYRVEAAPADIQPELAELDRLEAESMEAFERRRNFGQGVLVTVNA
jgi:hypothetical protein